jgi:coproporphyrinogen III oxidase-like Fe-S oxidoreductase
MDAGFNRLSIGVQSFYDPKLKGSGAHTRRRPRFDHCLREGGFRNINADLNSRSGRLGGAAGGLKEA